jgi:serine-threonine kinase receptor-associated protein
MNNSRQIPLTCSGHSRPVVQIQMSPFVENNKYYLISACKGILFNIVLVL